MKVLTLLSWRRILLLLLLLRLLSQLFQNYIYLAYTLTKENEWNGCVLIDDKELDIFNNSVLRLWVAHAINHLIHAYLFDPRDVQFIEKRIDRRSNLPSNDVLIKEDVVDKLGWTEDLSLSPCTYGVFGDARSLRGCSRDCWAEWEMHFNHLFMLWQSLTVKPTASLHRRLHSSEGSFGLLLFWTASMSRRWYPFSSCPCSVSREGWSSVTIQYEASKNIRMNEHSLSSQIAYRPLHFDFGYGVHMFVLLWRFFVEITKLFVVHKTKCESVDFNVLASVWQEFFWSRRLHSRW